MDIKQKHSKCHYYRDLLDPLKVFCHKLKHFQLCYQSISSTIEEVKYIMQKNNLDGFGEEFYVMQIERQILEFFMHIASIRDCLKNKILATKPGEEVVNGKLHGNYAVLDTEHNKILAETLDSNPDLKIISGQLRNKLLHSNLHETRFVTTCIKPLDQELHRNFTLACDFERFMFLIGWEKKYYSLSKYYLDEHIIAITNAVANEKGYVFKEIIERVHACKDCHVYFAEFEINSQSSSSGFILPGQVELQYQIEKYLKRHINLYDKLLQSKDYRFYALNKFYYEMNREPKSDKLIKKPKCYLDLELLIGDIYQYYMNYYLKFHALIKEYHKKDLVDFLQLQKDIGVLSSELENMRTIYYSIEVPQNKHYQDSCDFFQSRK